MAIVANTFLTYDARGIREELSDVIFNLAPTQTPFSSSLKRTGADNDFYEWQTDSLAAVDTNNAHIEGDDVTTYTAVSPTVRIGNYTQISRKTLIISGTEERVKKAGRKSELAYQTMKRGKEAKRDIESILLANQAAVAGNSTTARKTGALAAFVRTNVTAVLGTGGANPPALSSGAPTTARTDGTTRAFTETLLKEVIATGYSNGAEFKVLMLGPAQKQVASGFSGVATKTIDQSAAKPATIIGAADVYVSDFGILRIVPNRFQRNRDAWLLDYSFMELKQLRPFHWQNLAKTGDATKKLLLIEWGFKIGNELSQGLVPDLS